MQHLDEVLSGLREMIMKKAEELAEEMKKDIIDDDLIDRAILIVIMKQGLNIKQLVLDDIKTKKNKKWIN